MIEKQYTITKVYKTQNGKMGFMMLKNEMTTMQGALTGKFLWNKKLVWLCGNYHVAPRRMRINGQFIKGGGKTVAILKIEKADVGLWLRIMLPRKVDNTKTFMQLDWVVHNSIKLLNTPSNKPITVEDYRDFKKLSVKKKRDLMNIVQ